MITSFMPNSLLKQVVNIMDTNSIVQEDLLAKGYGMIPKLVMKDRNLSAEAKAIYAYLCSYCGAGDTAFPSVELICHDLGISIKRFQRHIKQLKDSNYLTITRNRQENGFSNNIYKLPKTVQVHFVPEQIVTVRGVPVQNVPTNINSLKSNSINKNNIDSGEKPEKVPVKKIIDHLNKVADSRFSDKSSDTQKHIKARWNEGNDLDTFIAVIDHKTKEWKDDPTMSKYLRPSTLFAAKNFENYKAAAFAEQRKRNKQQSQSSDIDLKRMSELFGDLA